MLALLPLLASAAPAAPEAASTLEVQYRVTFEVADPTGALCSMAKVCPCESVYEGTGAKPKRSGDRITFKGTWAIASNTCSEQFTLWGGVEGKVHHSLTFDDGTLSQWVVHRDADAHEPLKSGMKEGGQVYLTALSVPWAADGVLAHEESEEKEMMSVKITTKHAFKVTLAD